MKFKELKLIFLVLIFCISSIGMTVSAQATNATNQNTNGYNADMMS